MNVLLVSHLYPSHLSATSGSFVHNQARFLAAHDPIRVVSPVPWSPPLPGAGRWSSYRRLPRHETRDGIEVARPRFGHLPKRLWPSLTIRRFGAALAPWMTPAPGLIHAHCAFPDGAAAVRWGRTLRVPVVVTVHGHDLKDLPAIDEGWRRQIADTLGAADAVIAVSRELATLAVELGASPERVHRIPNGVDCQLHPTETSRSPGEGGWRLLYVGRFHKPKGLEELLQATRRLVDAGRDVRVELIGGNPVSGTAAPFAALARELGLDERVQFHDEIPHDEVPQRMAQADVFVLPSHSEGLPLVLIEALAAGLPIVSTRCGGPEELVDEATGRLAGVRDPAGLADEIDAVIGQYDRYDRDAIRGRARRDYDYRVIAARIHALYEETAAQRR